MPRLSNPFIQFLNGNGDALDGNQLFFFETGTSTPKDTFSDAGLTTANTNPVVADSDGRVPNVELDGIYKVVLKDKNGVTIATADPIGGDIEGQWSLWLNDTSYNIPDIVTGSDDEFYRSLTDANQGNDPTSSPTNWEQLELGRIWSIGATYSIGDDVIASDGEVYQSLTNTNIGNDPTSSAANWKLFNRTEVWNTNVTYAAADNVIGSDGRIYISAVSSNSGNDPTTDTTNWEPGAKTIIMGTEQASTSGTEIDFTGIPAETKRIVVMFSGVSTNGTSDITIQIGDAGGIEISGYAGAVANQDGSSIQAFSAGFDITASIAATTVANGKIVLDIKNSSTNEWVASSQIGYSNLALFDSGAGVKSLSAELTQLRITTLGSVDTFDAGSINISYEK